MLEPTLRNCWYIFKQNCAAALFKWNVTNYSPSEMKSNGVVLFESPDDINLGIYEAALMAGGYQTLRTSRLGHFVYAVEALAPRVIVLDPHFIPGGYTTHHEFINFIRKMSPESLLVGIEPRPEARQLRGQILNGQDSILGYHTGELNPHLSLDLIVNTWGTIPFELPGLIEAQLKK